MKQQTIEEFAAERGLTVEEVTRHLNKITAQPEANAEPLPGPLADAFPARSITICGVRVRPFVAYDRVLLRALNSPIHLQLLEISKPPDQRKETPFDDLECFETIWLFSHTCEECAVALGMDMFDPLGAEGLTEAKRKSFRKRVVKEIGLKMDATVASMITVAIGEQISKSISTALSYGRVQDENEEITNFTRPPAVKTTDLAGGSAISEESSAPIHK